MNIAQRIAAASKLTGEFVLRSGEVSNTYFDKYLFESDPVLLGTLAERLAALVPPDTDIVAGLEMGGIPVVTALSLNDALRPLALSAATSAMAAVKSSSLHVAVA